MARELILNGGDVPTERDIPSNVASANEAAHQEYLLKKPKEDAQRTLDAYDQMGLTRAWEDLVDLIPGSENALPQVQKDRLAEKRAARAVVVG